jgi:hypothetical protein
VSPTGTRARGWREWNGRINQAAHAFRALGLNPKKNHYYNQQPIPMKGKPPGWSCVLLGRSDLREKRFPHAKPRQPAWVCEVVCCHRDFLQRVSYASGLNSEELSQARRRILVQREDVFDRIFIVGSTFRETPYP